MSAHAKISAPERVQAAIVRSTLIVIVGPTGSGKSDLAVRLATQLEAPIISTDSRQVYEGMRIGTAQPTEVQLAAVEHHFIADRPPTERFTCGDFEREALTLLDELFTRQRLSHPEERPPRVIAVGGSGLYIDALCNGLDTLPDINPELRKYLTNRLLHDGLKPLLELLSEKDPVTHASIDRQNPARVLRALEVCLQTGRPVSELRTGPSLRKAAQIRNHNSTDTGANADASTCNGTKTSISAASSPISTRPFDIIKLGIDLPRPDLYARIDSRVDAMMAEGLEAEARSLYPHKHLPALQTVGYSELFDHFDGLYTDSDGSPLLPEKSLARAVELIKRNSRRYAKRQMTWFRRDGDIRWLTHDEIVDPATLLKTTLGHP